MLIEPITAQLRMKKSFLPIVCLGFGAFLLVALRPDDDDYLAVFGRIHSEVNANSKAYETLADATQKIGHRLMGTPNGTRAEQMAFDLFKKYGYEVRFQALEADAWLRDTATLEVVPNKSDNFMPIPVVSLAHSPTDAKIQGQIIDVGNGLEADFETLKDKIKGKVVLANLGLTNAPAGSINLHQAQKTAMAIRCGATGVIMICGVPGQVLVTGSASQTGSLILIPAVCISQESGQELRQWLIDDKNLYAFIEMRNMSKRAKPRNVVATLKGSGYFTKEKIVVGGHLDSWDLATGATANGLGAFSVIDIARTFKALKLKPKRTVEFVLFAGQEQGLLGSKHYVKDAIKTQQINNIALMYNLDMTYDPKGINLNGRDEMRGFFEQIGRQIAQTDAAYANTIISRAALHTDDQPFMIEGLPTIAPVSVLPPAITNCYHANCDRIGLVNKDALKRAVSAVSMLLYASADASEIPAKRLDSNKTRDYLVAQGLKKELVSGQNWKWVD